MREILFRAKLLFNRKWVYGSFVREFDGYPQIISDEDGGMYEVVPETVGQYTGLLDKNGRKIFEGDILHIAKIADGLGGYYHPPIDCPVNVMVKWDLCEWTWETLCENKLYISFPDAWCHYECEIIGNIYDNPELIGGEANG